MHTAKESYVNCLHSGVVFPDGPKHCFKTFKMKQPENSNINDLAETRKMTGLISSSDKYLKTKRWCWSKSAKNVFFPGLLEL